MNKIISKEIFIKNKIKTPKFISLKKNYNRKKIIKILNIKRIRFPIVLKPNNEGSSLGVEICKDKKKLFSKINSLIKKYSEIILEEYMVVKKSKQQ